MKSVFARGGFIGALSDSDFAIFAAFSFQFAWISVGAHGAPKGFHDFHFPSRAISGFSPSMTLGFFASHGGSNMQAILDGIKAGRLDARAALLITNNRKCQALERAEREGLAHEVLNGVTHPDPEDLDAAMLAALREHGVDLIVLAGYMKKIGPRVLAAYEGRIVNIHPALLPRFGGQGMFGHHVHRAVLEAGEGVTGATVHLVDANYDEGRILAQAEVPVLPDDTVETLAARVLVAEHQLFVDTLARIEKGQLAL